MPSSFPILLSSDPGRRQFRLGAWLLLLVTLAGNLALANSPVNPRELLGRTQAEVESLLGKPISTLARGNTRILVFPGDVRLELTGNHVVSARSASFGEIVAADGRRYLVDEKGVARSEQVEVDVVEPVPAEAAANEAAPVAMESNDVAAPPETRTPSGVPEKAPVQPDGTDDVYVASGVDSGYTETHRQLEHALNGMTAQAETGNPGAGEGVIGQAVGAVVHLAIILVMLSVTLKWLGLPFVWRDLARVAVLALAVREVLHGLGGLGGNWAFVRLFRLDEGISFVALAVLLFRFKVTLTGLTALKVAAATKLVSYMLMIGVGVALSFGLLAMQ